MVMPNIVASCENVPGRTRFCVAPIAAAVVFVPLLGRGVVDPAGPDGPAIAGTVGALPEGPVAPVPLVVVWPIDTDPAIPNVSSTRIDSVTLIVIVVSVK